MTIDCPLDCEYLQEARIRDKVVPFDPENAPNKDIRVSEDFINEREEFIAFLGSRIAAAALATPGVVDSDVREALEGLIRTYRTLLSGVYYQSRPENPLAQRIFSAAEEAIGGWRTEEQRRFGMSKTRDADALGVLVFLHRILVEGDNGRRRGRVFIDTMRRFYSGDAESSPRPTSTPLILP